MAASGVRATGLRKLGRDVDRAKRKIENTLSDEIRRGVQRATRTAKSSIPRGPGRPPGHAADYLKYKMRGKFGIIEWGKGVDLPYTGWLEFGGTISPRGTAIRRKHKPGGYYVYPAIRKESNEIVKRVGHSIDNVLKASGFQ